MKEREVATMDTDQEELVSQLGNYIYRLTKDFVVNRELIVPKLKSCGTVSNTNFIWR